LTYAEWEWIIPVLSIIGFVVGILVTWRQYKIPGIGDVIDAITTYYLDEQKFTFQKISADLKLPDPVVKHALKELERRDVIYRTKSGWFAMNDPLIFLSEKDMIRAKRLTKGDNLIYGAYQNPFFSHSELLLVYGIFIGTIIFGLVCGFIEPARTWLLSMLGTANIIDGAIFLLFIIMVGMITTDALENLISIWSRERYSVIIGEMSGISYDTSYSDEYSGRIGRGMIRRADLQITPIQKFMNYFMRVPIGDIRICCVAKKDGGPEVEFKNLPFPREMFYVIRSIQLKSLGWRKRHARTLMLWRARGAIPSIGF